MTTVETQTYRQLIRARDQLHAEMMGATGQRDPEWWRDRIDEMGYLNRQIAKIRSGQAVG